MKKVWRRLHLGLALLSAIFLLILCGSGAVLIYAKPLQSWWQPQYWQVKVPMRIKLQAQAQTALPIKMPTKVPPKLSIVVPTTPLIEAPPAAALLPAAELINAAQLQSGQLVKLLSVEQDPTLAWQAQLADGSYLSLDPYRGTVLYHYQAEQTLYGFTLALHRWLLLQYNGERPLQDWVSVVATMLILSLFSGLYLWAKPKQRLKRLKVRWRAKPLVRWQQLHGVLGVTLCLPLFLLAFSGIAFHWTTPTSWLIETLTGGPIQARPAAPAIPLVAALPAPAADAPVLASDQAVTLPETALVSAAPLQTAINQGLAALPGAQLFRVQLPSTAAQPLLLRLQMPGEFYPNSYVWLHPQSGQVLQVHDASQLNLSSHIWNFRYPFHIGNFAGPVVQALWLLLALLPVFFLLSGWYLSWQRRLKSK